MAVITGNAEQLATPTLTVNLRETITDGYTITFPYIGTYAACEAFAHTIRRGDKFEEAQARGYINVGIEDVNNQVQWLKVIDVNITETEGGAGEVLVSCARVFTPYNNATQTDPTSVEWEIQNTELRLPLAAHPDFPKEHINDWLLFIASPANIQVQKLYLQDPSNPDSPTGALPTGGGLDKWAEKYLSGLQDFPLSLPIVVLKETYDSIPQLGAKKLYKRDSPSEGLPSKFNTYLNGLESVLTGDTLTYNEQTGIFTRTRQWTYASEWDETFYPN